MVDYSKFDNIVLSSDEEDENERQNLEEHFENNNLVPIIFSDIKQIPEMTAAIDKLKAIITRLHPQKVVKDVTLGVLENVNNLSILWKENVAKENIFLLVNHEILKKYMDEKSRRTFFESVVGFGANDDVKKLKKVLVVFSPFHDQYWYQADCDGMDNNTMERWYQSWMIVKCCVCFETDDVTTTRNKKMDQCGTCFSCVCKGCLQEHKEANQYPMFKCPICRTAFYKIVLIPNSNISDTTPQEENTTN